MDSWDLSGFGVDTSIDDAMGTIPPGEEAMFLSHAGSEEDVIREMLNGSGVR